MEKPQHHDKVEGAARLLIWCPMSPPFWLVLPRRNEWVFSSPAESGRLMEPRIGAHNKALTAAGPPLFPHGLQAVPLALSPNGLNAQRESRHKIMGHKPSATAEKHYRRRPLDLLLSMKWHVSLNRGFLIRPAEQPIERQSLTAHSDAVTTLPLPFNST